MLPPRYDPSERISIISGDNQEEANEEDNLIGEKAMQSPSHQFTPKSYPFLSQSLGAQASFKSQIVDENLGSDSHREPLLLRTSVMKSKHPSMSTISQPKSEYKSKILESRPISSRREEGHSTPSLQSPMMVKPKSPISHFANTGSI